MLEIAIGKNQVIWVKAQAVKGTAIWPTAGDAVLLTSDANFKQDRVFNMDKQKRLTVSPLGRKAGVYKGGEFSFSTYIKPSGSLGVVPVPAVLLKALLGKETIVANTSVTYSLAAIDDDFIYLTILVKDNFESFLIQDLLVNKGSIKIKAGEGDDALVGIDLSGIFLKSILAGTDALAQLEALGATELHVANPGRFEAGQKIIVGTSGLTAGHLIESVDVSGGHVTIAATGLESEQASGVVIKPWFPSITESGTLIHGRFGLYQEKIGAGDYTTVYITEATVDIDNTHKVLNDEKTDSGFPNSNSKGVDRISSFKISRYFRSDGSIYRYQANNQVQKAIKLPAGNVAGSRMRIEMPKVEFDTPAKSGDAERILSLDGHPFASSALDDELKIVFD